MSSPVAHLFAGGAFSFAGGSNSKQSRAQEALEDAQWKPPPPAVGPAGAPRSKSPLKRFDADTPVVRRAREAARNAKADYLQRKHPVNPDFNTPEMRNRLPPLPPPLTASQLNITTETQTRVEGAPMLGLGVTREAAAAAAQAAEVDDDPYSSFGPEASAPKRMESTYTGLEQAIIDMTAASIRESKAQPLPRPTPQPKKKTKKSNDITAQFEKKQAALAKKKAKDAAYAQAQLQAQQQALAQQQQQQAPSTGLKIITDESHSNAVNTLTLTHEDGSPIIVAPPALPVVEEKESQQPKELISLPLLPRMPTPRNQYSSESEDSTAYTSSSSSSSSDAEADDFAEERAERIAQARAFHASLRNNDDASDASSSAPGSSMGARKGGVGFGDQRPGDTPSASSLIVWRENHRVQAARDIPASVAAQLLAEPTAEDRMEQLLRIHRAEDEAEALMAAAAQAEAELEAEMKAMNGAASASTDSNASNDPAPPTPQHIRFAQARDGLREFQPADPQPLPASPFPMLVPGTPILRPDPQPLIAASEYADPSSRFEAEHTPLLAKAAAIIDKEVRFDYLSQQAAKIAAAAAAKKAKADEAKIEEMLDSGGSRAAIHAMLGSQRSVAAVVRPDFKFQLYPERASKAEMREQVFAGLSAEHANKGVLSPQQKRRKEALARREAARAAREAASPSPSNPLPAFRPPHSRPHAFDPLAGSSFVPPTHLTSPKKKLGAWYLPAKQWRSVEVVRDNEEQREREEAEEAAQERAEYEASLPRSMQEKSLWLRESIPTLFIASVYKGHLESISKAQQAAAAKEAKELAAQERNASYAFHKGKLPSGPAGGRTRGISAVLVTPPTAAGATNPATTVAGSLNSTTTSLGPVVRGGSATSTASSPAAARTGSSTSAAATSVSPFPSDPLAHTPVRMPSYLDGLIPLDSNDERTVIVDFAPNTNKVAALAPILAEAAKAATGGGIGTGANKGGKGWSKHGKSAANSASTAAQKVLAAEEAAALLSNPNIAILQARAIAAAEAQAVRTATIGITPNSAARLTAMTASQQSKQREKLAPISPTAEAAPRSAPHFITRTPPPAPDTTFKKAHQSSHSISDMILAHQSSSVAASLRESVTLSPEEVEAQTIMQQALERRRRNASTPQPRLPSGKPSRNSSRPGSASPSPRPSPRSGSAGEVRFASSPSHSSAVRHTAYAKQPHVRHQSLSGSHGGSASRSSKSDRQSVSSRDSYDAALAGLATQSHHSHVFLPNVSPASAMASNKERAAANVSMLTRLHEQAAELEKERAAAAAAAAAGSGPSSSPRQSPKHTKQQSLGTVLTLATAHPAVIAATAAASSSGSASASASASPTLSGVPLSSVQSSSILDHREFAPDDQEYQHPLEVGMRREPRLMHFQRHQQQRASIIAAQQQQQKGEGLLNSAQLKTIAMRRLAEGEDEDDDEDDGAQHRRQHSDEQQDDAADEEAEESDRRRRSQESNHRLRPVHIAPVSISLDEFDAKSWGSPLSPTHLSATTPLMSPAARTQLPQRD